MKKVINYIFPMLILLHLVLWMLWLVVTLTVVWFGWWLATSNNIHATKFRKKSFLVYPVVLIGAFALAIVLRLFFFGVYIIPSGSMERTIVPGDVVWVNKLTYGPQTPVTPYEIPWINVLFWLAEGKDADVNKERWKNRRLTGYSQPKHGDVTVFNHPYKKEVYIKRCMALPGDTIQIENGIVYVNSHEIAEAPNVLFRSRVSVTDMNQFYHESDSAMALLNKNSIAFHRDKQLALPLTRHEAASLAALASVVSVGADPEWLVNLKDIHPRHEGFNWTLDDFGSFVIPRKGLTIELTERNFRLYRRVINAFEGVRIRFEDGICSIDGQQAEWFTFTNDYYFMMGDNRHDSNDSRYFGPVPESRLAGKATFILWSGRKDLAWHKRLFRKMQ